MERFTRGSNEEALPLYNIAVPGDRLAVPDELDVSKTSSPGEFRTTSAQSRGVADEYSYMTLAETATRLQTSLTYGLSPAEALSRLRDHGPNEIPHEEPEPLWLRFLGQFKEPLIVLLLVSAGASLLLGNTDDAVSITVAVTIVVTVGFVQEYRSEKSIEALNHLVPAHAHLVRSAVTKPTTTPRTPNWPGSASQQPTESPDSATPEEEILEATSTKVMAAQLVPGDLVLFTTGDRIPADIRVTKATDLTIDASNLTGENEPVRITAEARTRRQAGSSLQLPTPSFAAGQQNGTSDVAKGDDDGNNIAYMGTLVKSGHGQGIVYATGGNTLFGTVAASVSGTESPRSPLQLSMDDLGSQLSKMSFVVIGLIRTS